MIRIHIARSWFDTVIFYRTTGLILAFLSCLFFLMLCATGCQPFKPKERPLNQELPEQFALYTGAHQADLCWWKTFNDPELNHLIETALADNLTIKEAWARLRQAQAVAVQNGAARFPDLTASGDYSLIRQKTELLGETRAEEYGLSAVSRYEVDLWGRVRAQYQAARLTAEASREDLSTAAITIAAEVAQRWVAIISQRMQHALLEEQLRINLTLLELVDLRFKNAMVSALDVYQQKQLVDNVLAEIPLVEQEEQLLSHQLALLLGKPPRAKVLISAQQLPDPSPLPPTGLPADLLAERPDIRAAGLRLHAADWQIAQARANRLPTISLSAGGAYSSDGLDTLFDNWLTNLAANLTLPLIDGGRRRAEVDRTRAIADEDFAAYRNSVLTAIKEVEDALVKETKQREHIEALHQVAETARKALEEAAVRYRNGLNDYLPVLNQLVAVQKLERELISKKASLLIARVSLYRALGGSWPENLEMPSNEKQQSKQIGKGSDEHDE